PRPPHSFPTRRSSDLERPLLDSVVAVAKGQVYVGGLARQLGLVGAAHSFSSIKRYMGRHWFRMHAGYGWTPERVSGCILRVVHKDRKSTRLNSSHRTI